MAIKFKIKENYFQDSLSLTRISKGLRDMQGVEKTFAVMGTENGKISLEDSGLMISEIEKAGKGDLVMAVQADSEERAESVLEKMEKLISSLTPQDKSEAPDILNGEIQVINVGLEIFKEALDAQGVRTLHVNWEVPADGDVELVNILKKMY